MHLAILHYATQIKLCYEIQESVISNEKTSTSVHDLVLFSEVSKASQNLF